MTGKTGARSRPRGRGRVGAGSGLLRSGRVFTFLTASPWLNLALFWGLAALVRASNGRWPDVYENPRMPLGVHIDFYALPVTVSLYLLAPLCLALWLAALAVRLTEGGAWRGPLRRRAAVVAAGWAAFVGLFAADPFGYVDWWID